MPPETSLRIISFDGGGVRGLSQLEIMRNIMHRLDWDNESDVSMEGTLPCERFDLMCGSGTGGLIAILFAKLRMSVEEASEEFCTIMEQVYNPHGLSPSERTARLRKCLGDAMKRKELPLDLRLTQKARLACSAFVVASPRTNSKSVVCLRTYPVRSQPTSTISVIEAVLATCATQPEFAPISSGSSFKLREYIAAGGAANPIHEAITEAHLLFGGDSSVASLLSLGIGHPGIITLPSSGGEAALYRIMRDMMDDCEQRALEIEQRIGRVGIYSRFSVEQGMQNDHPEKFADVTWIVSQTENYLSRHETSEKLDLFVQNSGAQTTIITLDQLKHVGGPTASSQLTASVERSLGILISNQDDAIIAKLKLADLESGSHAAVCMEGTRRDILGRIDAWAADIDAPNILWLSGHPGVGKSAIASSLVENWRSSGRLGSSFFFRRERADVMTPNALWRTVAYDLGRRYPTIRKHLVTALNADETLPSTSNPDTLFLQLIHETLTACEMTDCDSLPIIVVDALDECGGVDGRHSDHRKALMRTLESWSSLPGRFKLVVSSRSERDIERLFSTTAHHPLEISAGQKVDSTSLMDIQKFLKHHLQQIANQYASLPSDWPGDQIIVRLADRAAGLFIWVKTVIKLLERGEPLRTLKQILEGGGAGGMADLYSWILNVSFPNPSHEDIRDFHSTLGTLIFTKSPLDRASLAQLLSLESPTMEYICNGLRSVLDSGDSLRIHHQSFTDFLLDPKDCPPEFLIIRERENRNLTVACLKIMNSHLRFNICELDSSYPRNSEVLDLQLRIEKHIPRHLSYSSRFWADHLAQTIFDGELFAHLQFFMENQFLFWLEILSLTGMVNIASSMLSTLLTWIRTSYQDDSLAADMQKFVAGFASIISQSASHIYLSALPFSPRGIGVSKQYLARYPRTLTIQRGGQSHWPAIQNVISEHTGSVYSVAFSPDGRRIVSGSRDQSVRVWDAETGQIVLGPLKGHTGRVNSVAFSLDGLRIVSGSDDCSVRVWDAETSQTVLRPLKGHSGHVYSVVFSPDGRHIVSGSGDNSVRVWDAKTGQTVLGPLKGHIGGVNSVAFSPDGRRIVSGSNDCSVRVWGAETGRTLSGPLEGHSDWVRSVSFSPDGRHVVSGSDDQSVRIWDVETGQTVLGPLKGHLNFVYSVAFSLDGRRIISGSADQSLRVWDVQTGQTVLGPLSGHIGHVYSVAFSPDGRRIVSGSDDCSIRLWDVETSQTLLRPLEGHSDWVRSVSFSPDGRQIVSGSDDQSLRVWDVQTGQTVLGPLKGHTGCVYSVAFSPDGQYIVSGSSDKSVRVWEAQTGQTLLRPLGGHTSHVNSVAFSPDGRYIVSGSNDKSVRVWDVQTGETVLGSLEGHVDHVRSVAFSPDGRHIASGSNDQSLRIWNAETGQTVLGPLKGHTGTIFSVSFSPDGRCIVAGSDYKTVRVWDTQATQSAEHIYSSFQNSSYTKDGWILGPKSELLFWVPPDVRTMLCPLRNTLVLGGDPTQLDLKHFVHGPAWACCKDPPA